MHAFQFKSQSIKLCRTIKQSSFKGNMSVYARKICDDDNMWPMRTQKRDYGCAITICSWNKLWVRMNRWIRSMNTAFDREKLMCSRNIHSPFNQTIVVSSESTHKKHHLRYQSDNYPIKENTFIAKNNKNEAKEEKKWKWHFNMHIKLVYHSPTFRPTCSEHNHIETLKFFNYFALQLWYHQRTIAFQLRICIFF